MDGHKFDDVARALAAGASRRTILKGLFAGAVGAVGLGRAARVGAGPSGTRTLGQSCRSDADCQPGQHLFCDQVGTTGASRCECTLGFESCDGVCVSTTCPGGAAFDAATCSCACPADTEVCGGACVASCPAGTGQVLDSNCACNCPPTLPNRCPATGVCSAACTGGTAFNTTTCTCTCPVTTCDSGACLAACPTGTSPNTATCSCDCPVVNGQTGTFCNGQCHYDAECCAGRAHCNKNFNAFCCSCQNPGQPSGTCK